MITKPSAGGYARKHSYTWAKPVRSDVKTIRERSGEKLEGSGDKPKVAFEMTTMLGVKVVLAFAFGSIAVYYLSSGRKHSDFGRLMWAAVFALLTCIVFAL